VLEHYRWLKQTPTWFKYAFIPVFGGLAIAYAGDRAKVRIWTNIGLVLTFASIVLFHSEATIGLWLVQVMVALSIKKTFLQKTLPPGIPIIDVETAKIVAQNQGKIEINTCSKNDLVYRLNLPIVYANNIESLRHEGYIFTYLEELSELAEIPPHYLPRLEPLVTFSYDYKQETDFSWRRLNSYSVEELINCDINPEAAAKIVSERNSGGAYKSLIDVRNRTGIPISVYKHLV
jgi:DNA uptake protein ComE-like DNA-binding protein